MKTFKELTESIKNIDWEPVKNGSWKSVNPKGYEISGNQRPGNRAPKLILFFNGNTIGEYRTKEKAMSEAEKHNNKNNKLK